MQKSKSERPAQRGSREPTARSCGRKAAASRDLIIESLVEEEMDGQPEKFMKTYTFTETNASSTMPSPPNSV